MSNIFLVQHPQLTCYVYLCINVSPHFKSVLFAKMFVAITAVPEKRSRWKVKLGLGNELFT